MLNDYQKRGLSITLRIVEENVEYIEQLLKSRGYSGVLYETRYDLTDEIRDELSKRIPLMRAELGRIADKFQHTLIRILGEMERILLVVRKS